MKRTGLFLVLLLFCGRLLTGNASGQTAAAQSFDVLHYDAQIEPHIAKFERPLGGEF